MFEILFWSSVFLGNTKEGILGEFQGALEKASGILENKSITGYVLIF